MAGPHSGAGACSTGARAHTTAGAGSWGDFATPALTASASSFKGGLKARVTEPASLAFRKSPLIAVSDTNAVAGVGATRRAVSRRPRVARDRVRSLKGFTVRGEPRPGHYREIGDRV